MVYPNYVRTETFMGRVGTKDSFAIYLHKGYTEGILLIAYKKLSVGFIIKCPYHFSNFAGTSAALLIARAGIYNLHRLTWCRPDCVIQKSAESIGTLTTSLRAASRSNRPNRPRGPLACVDHRTSPMIYLIVYIVTSFSSVAYASVVIAVYSQSPLPNSLNISLFDSSLK